MRPKERRESGQNDLFRARLDQIVDMVSMGPRFSSKVRVGRIAPLLTHGDTKDWRHGVR